MFETLESRQLLAIDLIAGVCTADTVPTAAEFSLLPVQSQTEVSVPAASSGVVEDSSKTISNKHEEASVTTDELSGAPAAELDPPTAVSSNQSEPSLTASEPLVHESDEPLSFRSDDVFQYAHGDHQVKLTVHPTRVAMALSKHPEAMTELTSHGFTLVRGLDTDYAIFESAFDVLGLAQSLKSAGTVSDVLPVFVFEQTKSEAVLLNELIVSFKPDSDPAAFFNENEAFTSFRRLAGSANQYVAIVSAGNGAHTLALLNHLQSKASANIEWIEPNFYQNWQKYFTPNDPRFENQWHLDNTGQNGALVDADADLPEAWDLNPGGSPDYVIGIIDDGVEAHPDLTLWINPGEIADNGIDDDGNGWVDDIHGWNFVSDNNQSGPLSDQDIHGTPVAGVAAATGDNSLGVTGASYKSVVSSARIFNALNATSDANIAAAVYYMAGRTADGVGTWKSADVINNSWGGGAGTSVITNALDWASSQGRLGAGAPLFFATGGSGGQVSYPASLSTTMPGLFAVGAMNSSGLRASNSNFGSALDFVAAGSDALPGYLGIDTTDRVGAVGLSVSDYTGTSGPNFGGTSAAAALAAGVVALVMDQADDLGVNLAAGQLKNYLHQTTDLVGGVSYDMSTGRHLEYGFGALNAYAAVAGIGKVEISVLASNGELASGVSAIDLGAEYLGSGRDVTFRIRNQGTSTLDLSSLNLTTAAADFMIVAGFSDAALSVGEATTFTLHYQPTTLGHHTATIAIGSNDSDEAEFNFEITGTGLRHTLSGRVFEDWDGDSLIDLQDEPLNDHEVFLDENANGFMDRVSYLVLQGSPTAIIDESTVTSQLEVTGTTAPIRDINVRFDISHTWTADLQVVLISPSGERVILLSAVGGSEDNFTDTILDDEALIPISLGSAPFNGAYQPAEPLAIFDGLDANGLWTLEVTDTVDGDNGTINNWSLVIVTGEQSVMSDASGAYYFDDLAPATYQVRSLTPDTWMAMDANLHEVTINTAADYFVDLNFATAKNNRYYGLVFDDADRDGLVGAEELPLQDRRLFIDLNGNGLFDDGETSQLSDDRGRVAFDLLPGTHEVYLQSIGNWSHTLPIDGHRSALAAGTPISDQTFGTTADDLIPPTLSAAWIAGSTWSSALLSFVDNGNDRGMPLAAGMSTLVFDDLNMLKIQFSEDVLNVSNATIELRDSTNVIPITVTYDASTLMATVSWTSALPSGKYRLGVSDAITDIAGNTLDGDFNDAMGGVFDLRFDVLPGDSNGDRLVSNLDVAPFAASFNAQVGQQRYDIRMDWNADGRINGLDLPVFAASNEIDLSSMAEPAQPFSGGGGGQATSNAVLYTDPLDEFFKQLAEEDDSRKLNC